MSRFQNAAGIAVCCLIGMSLSFAAEGATKPGGYSIPLIDLAGERHRQIVVDKEPGQYLGHPTTLRSIELLTGRVRNGLSCSRDCTLSEWRFQKMTD